MIDPYLIPGTDTLVNLQGISSADDLAAFEAVVTLTRGIELASRPVIGRFDLAHLQAINRRLFQDVYPWAGEKATDALNELSFPSWPAERACGSTGRSSTPTTTSPRRSPLTKATSTRYEFISAA